MVQKKQSLFSWLQINKKSKIHKNNIKTKNKLKITPQNNTVNVLNNENNIIVDNLTMVTTKTQKNEHNNFLTRLKCSLINTRNNLGSKCITLLFGKKIDNNLFEKLEEHLITSDVGIDTTKNIIHQLIDHTDRNHLTDAKILYSKLREEMQIILQKVEKPLIITDKVPFIILIIGVNGAGKTTTIGKLAHQFRSEGKSIMLAAGDTFRAAAIEQLQIWGARNCIPVITQPVGTDASSVIFNAIKIAQSNKIDILLLDTAGRLQNKKYLMEELKKIIRVIKKLDINAPHEVMLILDASIGQNTINQANLFNEIIKLTGIVLTKLDGTAKGGVIFSIADRLNIPIRYIGLGEDIKDLRPFKANHFIEALFNQEN